MILLCNIFYNIQSLLFCLLFYHSRIMRFLIFTTFVVVLIGTVSAWVAETFLVERIAILGTFVGLELSHNPGIAFGVRLPPVFQEMIISIALIVVAIIAVKQTRKAISYRLSALSFGLILGGGIGNIIDRIPDGVVTDFIQVGTFPIFNIPDSCITVGVVLLAGVSLVHDMRLKKA